VNRLVTLPRALIIVGCCVLAVLIGTRCLRFMINTPSGRNRFDIGQLSTAVSAFKTKFGFYPPSRIKLSETCNYPERDRPGTLDADSVWLLTDLWPGLRLDPGTEIDWNGNGKIDGDWTLEGDECLVFFLGGAQTRNPNRCEGFSTDRQRPLDTSNLLHRVGPFIQFESYRLEDIHGRGFFSYRDPFGKPYAYFSSWRGFNHLGGTDCPTLGVWPYAGTWDPKPQFHNPETFQIISAGADRKFGPGTIDAAHVWSPDKADTIPPEGRDDMTNFYDGLLGQRP
jgi:general secretion pathway protein G